MLTNVTYAGWVKYKHEDHPGEQPAIVDAETWSKVQALLRRNGRTGGGDARNRFGFTLKGLIRCAACRCAMTPSHSLQKKTKRYRYYVCLRATRQGWDACPAPSVPAGRIETFVAEQVRAIGRDPELRTETVRRVREHERDRHAQRDAELRQIDRDLAAWDAEVRAALARPLAGTDDLRAGLLADRHDRMRLAAARRTELQREKADDRPLPDARAIDEALARFDPVWEALTAREQGRVLQLLVERVDYDGVGGRVEIAFRPSGIRTLLDESGSTPNGGSPMTFRITREFPATRPGTPAGLGGAIKPTGRVPRVARLMALAIRFDGLVRDGTVEDYASLARLGQVTRARVTQIMNLLMLAPDIQEEILFLPPTVRGRDPIHLMQLQPVALLPNGSDQRRAWAGLKSRPTAASSGS